MSRDINADTEEIIRTFNWKPELKPRIEIPKLLIRHFVFSHVCEDGRTVPYCHAWSEFYYEVFEDSLPVFKYTAPDGKIYIWQIIGDDGNSDNICGNYIGQWPD